MSVGDIEDLQQPAVYLSEAQFKAELDVCLMCTDKPCKVSFIQSSRNIDRWNRIDTGRMPVRLFANGFHSRGAIVEAV
jgi:hypothetical protein